MNRYVKGPPIAHIYWVGLMGGILDCSLGGRGEIRYEMTFEFVSEADFMCVLHHFSSLTNLEGSWGQSCPENGPKPKLKFRFEFPNISPSQSTAITLK